MSTLERAIVIAATAHAEQVEKSGQPYVLHPLRVMLAMRTPVARMAAMLHDVVEDTAVTVADLAVAGFSPEVLEAVALLTHERSEPYDDYLQRVGAHDVARAVKLADLRDNLDPARLPEVTPRDEMRFARYRAALAALDKIEHAVAGGARVDRR